VNENVVSFFELVADASVFEGAFAKAKASAVEFAGAFKATSASVEADANKMGIAIERGIATGSMGRNQANTLIAERLKFYGQGSGGGGSAAGAGGTLGLVGLQSAAFALLALTGAATGAIAMTEHLVEAQAKFSQQILLSSQALGMNTADLQTWQKIASVAGVDQQQMVNGFGIFAKNLNDGAPALKAAGISLKDLGITTTDVGQGILRVADYMHNNANAAQNEAIAMALFGRSGKELVPILDQGSAAVQRYKGELEKMGVILSQNQLFQGAQAKAAMTEFTTAIDVAKSQLVGAALPGFTVFFQTLSVIMKNNANVWIQIGQTIGNVVMFITGLIAGLAGVSMADILAAPAQAGAAFEGLGNGAAGAAGGIDQAANAAAALTKALDDQIAVLREQKRAQDDVFTAQRQGLQDQLDALRDVTDHRRRQGEDIVSYQRRIAEVELNDKIKAVDRAKTNYDRQVDDQIAALERQKAAVKQASGQMGADLAAGMNTGMAGLNANLATGMTKAQKKLLETAHQMGEDIKAIFEDPNGDKAKAAADLGTKLGQAFMSSAINAIARSLQNSAIPGVGFLADATLLAQALVSQLPKSASGRITSGPTIAGEAGTEVILPMNDAARSLSLMEQSGMAALVRGAGGSGIGGGAQINITFTGPVADELVASRVIRELERQIRSRGLALSSGFG